MENKALGKGLSALIPGEKDRVQGGAVENAQKEGVGYLEVEQIKDNRLQPRINYDDNKLKELMESIKEKGILQPILVRVFDDTKETFEVIAGERRLKAARALNMTEVPVIIKTASDNDAFIMALIENIQREELNPIEEAQAYKKLMEEFDYTHEVVAKSVGKDRSTVSNTLRLLNLPEDIQKGLYNGELSVGHARALLGLEKLVEQKCIYLQILKNGLSVREVEALVKKINKEGADKNIKSRAEKSEDYEIKALEEDLQKVLGTKVHIMHKKKNGKIIIEYYSLEDLDRVLGLLKQ